MLWEASLNEPLEGKLLKPIVVTDSKPYWRKAIFPEYKAHRKSYIDPTFYRIVDIGKTLGYPILAVDGLEADDLAGLVVMYHKSLPFKDKETLYLLTTDTDWCQLVDDAEDIVWCNFGRHTPRIRRQQQVIDWAYRRFNILITDPAGVVKLKHQLGDSSDNLPPYLAHDLISLQGQGWLNSLSNFGYSINHLMTLVRKHYHDSTSRTRASL
jgi:5'-3' exonuclease